LNRRQLFTAIALLGLFGLPLVLPLLELRSPGSWSAWTEADRIAELVTTTLGLCALTLLLSMPPGIGLAVLLYRTDLPGRAALRSALAVGLFVPLPLFALAWQAVGGGGWRPWTQGLLWAALVHAAAALPWVVWLTGLGLRRVEPELEEDALTAMPAARVLWHVSLRRAAPAIGLAAVWVVLQTAGEITVTDLAVVRTFAEEVYTQFVTAGPDALGRAVAVSIPATLLTVLAVAALMRRWEGRLTVWGTPRPSLVLHLGQARWPTAVAVSVALAAYAGVPLISLLRQAGGADAFTATRLGVELRRAVHLQLGMVLDSLTWAAAAGVLAAGLALVASWAAADSRTFRRFLFVLAVALWAVPGPVLGFGLKAAIERLMDLEDLLLAWTTARPVRAVLYDLSTPFPVLWAHVARLFPYAVAFVWPAVRDVPRDLREAARVDGAGPWGEFRRVIWPSVRGAFGLAAVAVTALALGELGASKLVQVPGRQTFAQELFNQMHYAATATTAALALLQLALALAVAAAMRLIARRYT
jgi:iron(III) transport system permease protein